MVKNTSQRVDLRLRANKNWDLVFKIKTKYGPSLLIGSKVFLNITAKGFTIRTES